MAALSWERPALLQANNCASSYLLHGQVLQFGQRAGEQSHQEGGRAAHDINHGWGQDRNEGVLPGEGVQQGHYSMGAARQGAEERGTTRLAKAFLSSQHLPPAEKLHLMKYKCPRCCLSSTCDFSQVLVPFQSRPSRYCAVWQFTADFKVKVQSLNLFQTRIHLFYSSQGVVWSRSQDSVLPKATQKPRLWTMLKTQKQLQILAAMLTSVVTKMHNSNVLKSSRNKGKCKVK